MTERELRTARNVAAGIVGSLALSVLILGAMFGPEAMAAGAPLRTLGLEVRPCPGCPLCGMSRAFSCVARGEFTRAFEFNAGVVAAYPLALALAILSPVVLWRGRAQRS